MGWYAIWDKNNYIAHVLLYMFQSYWRVLIQHQLWTCINHLVPTSNGFNTNQKYICIQTQFTITMFTESAEQVNTTFIRLKTTVRQWGHQLCHGCQLITLQTSKGWPIWIFWGEEWDKQGGWKNIVLVTDSVIFKKDLFEWFFLMMIFSPNSFINLILFKMT